MICPKCKKQIPDKTLKCGHCGAKIATLCKKCGAYNSIYNLKCQSCANELLKLCPKCKAINLPSASLCRKCDFNFTKAQSASPTEIKNEILPKEEIEEKNIAPVSAQIAYNGNYHSQSSAKEAIISALSNKKIISLSGAKGSGKTVVLKAAISQLNDQQLTWLTGECSAITQLSPCGLIQDILLNFFNITNFCADSLKLKKESQKFFQSEFPSLTNEEIFNLLNFLYPTNTDFYENIFINKKKTFEFLSKIFSTIIDNNKTIFVIDNFEMIDGMSYEFLTQILKPGFIEKDFKILLIYNEIRPARGYLYSNSLKDASYADISLGVFDKTQTKTFIEQYLNKERNCPENIKSQLFELSNGNPAILEQAVLNILEYISTNGNFPHGGAYDFSAILKQRLLFLKEKNSLAYEILLTAAISGMKFYPAILNQIFELSEADFVTVLNLLREMNFIVQLSEFSYCFKNSMLWETLFAIAKNEENFVVINQKIFSIYSAYTLSSISLMAIIAGNLNQKLSALGIWTDNIKIASYIGDTSLYAISQKQCLALAKEIESENSSLIVNNINERLGKLFSKLNPTEALEYLPNAIANAHKLGNSLKEIELTGYLASCCIALGDYFGTIECVDSALEKLDPMMELETTLLKSRKLDALLNIGNSGQIVNLADSEIIPVLEKYINAKTHKNISRATIYSAWLKTHLYLANALVIQGDNRAFKILSTLFEIFKQNNFDEKGFICKAKLATAFANTLKGDIEESEKILEDTIKNYRSEHMDNDAISRWNLINILNNFTRKNYANLKEELFQVVTFANNVNDNFTKNILKTLLGKIFKDEENAKRALEIYSEQITYFAKEKNAIGALLTWYLIADANLVAEGPDKAIEVAEKALEVAKSPKICNYYFSAMFHKVIAESYMAKSEYELAKLNIEKAVMIARKFEILDVLAQLYHLYGKYLHDIALIKSDMQIDYVTGSAKMYKKAFLVAQALKNTFLMAQIEKSKGVLHSFCELNGIVIK